MLAEHRKRGYSIIQEAYAPGMNSMAAPVQKAGAQATGVIVVAGPASRLTLVRMNQFGSALKLAAEELAVSGDASLLLKGSTLT